MVQQKEIAMAYGMKKSGAFKPCKGCPTPMACKRKGKCMAKAKK